MWKTSQTSLRSVGMALAPAITLNRMYHCVPSSSKNNGADAQPAAEANQEQEHDGKQSRGGHRGGYLRDGLRDGGEPGPQSDVDSHGDGPEARQHQDELDAEECRAGAPEDIAQLRLSRARRCMTPIFTTAYRMPSRAAAGSTRATPFPLQRARRCGIGRFVRCGKMQSAGFERSGSTEARAARGQHLRAAQQIQHGRARRLRSFHLLELELLAQAMMGRQIT